MLEVIQKHERATLKRNIGQRVELHPGIDAWMQGDRYGEIVGLGNTRMYYDTFEHPAVQVKLVPYRVKLDNSGRTIRVLPEQVFFIA